MANLHASVFFCLALSMMAMASAKQFMVGRSMGWTVPGPNAMSYNQWAESNRFQIGDSLLFVYPPGQDSLLQVEKESYDTCNTTTYIQRFDDGNTVFTFNQSGAFYFISGNEANCMKNESLVVVVLAERRQPSPPPSPSPVSSSSPPPSPASSSPPSPPPLTSTEVTPSPAPTGEETRTPPPPNGASLKVVGFMGSVGAFLGWVLFVF
ncbi:early nodulin-like protein 18 [Elaeis guineensis]|uniref:Early nodulin-like protein 1 n=1 Tax=Elaeis guineensis var. tenera TaxID=51953 RepID=A0A6I9RTX2_ELAGV|nr:early nodulin-like protein 1 [Elaeis guineensis]